MSSSPCLWLIHTDFEDEFSIVVAPSREEALSEWFKQNGFEVRGDKYRRHGGGGGWIPTEQVQHAQVLCRTSDMESTKVLAAVDIRRARDNYGDDGDGDGDDDANCALRVRSKPKSMH